MKTHFAGCPDTFNSNKWKSAFLVQNRSIFILTEHNFLSFKNSFTIITSHQNCIMNPFQIIQGYFITECVCIFLSYLTNLCCYATRDFNHISVANSNCKWICVLVNVKIYPLPHSHHQDKTPNGNSHKIFKYKYS